MQSFLNSVNSENVFEVSNKIGVTKVLPFGGKYLG